MAGSGEVTRLLARVREGDCEASERLVPLVYDELRRMAASFMQRERREHTLQATALVHEAYLRLAGSDAPQNRAHFFAIAAHTMRQVLLDYARQHRAAKRGGPSACKVDLDAELLVGADALEGVMEMDQALERLSAIDPQQAHMIELRFFAGLTVEETAEVMGSSPTTIKREWRLAKAWLSRELGISRAE